ncbi:MAG TPA: peptidoglycan-binding domain-containing protein [Terriglobales bacterium]|nr:peptidoglycan-binding domain-containing protein [Terriglobales bacterium]
MATGARCLDLAIPHIGERYVLGAFAPKNNPNWKGPWDCAEFVSWCVFQAGQILYGVDQHNNPATADAYTGYFRDDLEKLGERITVPEAGGIVGAVVLRYPQPGAVGHVVFSDGKGGTVEAMGAAYGVRRGALAGRRWDTGIKIPGIYYDDAATLPTAKVAGPKANAIYYTGAPGMKNAKVVEIQKALLAKGFDPGPADGIFGAKTTAAVVSFQAAVGSIVDGEVGVKTAKALGIKLP